MPPERAAANEPRRLLRATRPTLADHEHSAAGTEAVEAFYRLAHDWLVVTEDGEELEVVPALELDEVVVA